MGAFRYVSINKFGSTVKGVVEADTEREARQRLREQGLIPTQIRNFNKQAKRKNKLSAQNLSLFTRQLATLLAAGIPLEEALRGVGEQTEKDHVRELIIGIRTRVMEGYGLAQAMGEFPYAFPELYRSTIEAGEQTGRLDLVLHKLAIYTETQHLTKQKVQQALIYPCLMFLISTGIIGFLLTFVVPKIIEVFTTSGQTLPIMTEILINISTLMQSYGLVCLGGIILLGILFKKLLTNHSIRSKWHHLLLNIPLLSYVIRTVNIARYIHTFSILFAAGVNVLDTMRISTGVVSNLRIVKAFELAAIRVREGGAIHQALKDTGFFTPMTLYLIASGEKSGKIADLMERAGMQLDEEISRLIETALTLLEPMIILFMGAVVLFIVLATLLPIFSMQQLV